LPYFRYSFLGIFASKQERGGLSSAQPETLFRVLSLDGGGSKGVYTLGVLREVEAIVGAPLCQSFDLIFGTSTGSIIAALVALGCQVEEIERLYFALAPSVMQHHFSHGRSVALKAEAEKLFQQRTFSEFRVPLGVVCTNHGLERPMIFKSFPEQAQGMTATFVPGFGCTIAEAVLASCSAYPFFEMVSVETVNQGKQLLMDGGYVANNPTLFALADAHQAFGKDLAEIVVLSVGVGRYNEPKKNAFHQMLFGLWPFRHMAKMFNTSSTTIEQLRTVLFPGIACVRINEAFPQPEYATDLLEADVDKLKTLHSLGRQSFARFEREFRQTFRV
jgi:predicted acylesterase/phospholipase RssA